MTPGYTFKLYCPPIKYALIYRQNRMKSLEHSKTADNLLATSDKINKLIEFTGNLGCWLALGIMAVSCTVVILRYALDFSAIGLQELVIYLHASAFMLLLGYTHKHNGHVRVDIFYRQASADFKAWVNGLGSILLLLPLSIFIGSVCWDFVMVSWKIQETSAEPGGIPAVYLLKSLTLIMPLLLGLHAVSVVLSSLAHLLGAETPDTQDEAQAHV